MSWTPTISTRRRFPPSASLGDGVLLVASARPASKPLFSPVDGYSRKSTSSAAPSTRSTSTSGIWWSKMGLFNNKEGVTVNSTRTSSEKVSSSSPTPSAQYELGTPVNTISNKNLPRDRVLSPEVLFCSSPTPIDPFNPLANASFASSTTIRPNNWDKARAIKPKRSLANLLDLRTPAAPRASFSATNYCDTSSTFTTPDLSEGSSDFSFTLPETPSPVSGFDSPDEFDDEGENDEIDEAYQFRHTLGKRGNLPHHRFPPEVAPYMPAYTAISLNSDYATYSILHHLTPKSSPTFHDYGGKPPQHVLDLGCGEGYWAAEAATTWKATNTKVVAFDLVDLSSAMCGSDSKDPAVTKNMHWVTGNFLNPLPYKDNTFDHVRMANLGLAVPANRWSGLIMEAQRVLKYGGRLEIIDDQLFFPEIQATYHTNRCHIAQDMEFLFVKMLKSLNISSSPHKIIESQLRRVFKGKVHSRRFELRIPVRNQGVVNPRASQRSLDSAGQETKSNSQISAGPVILEVPAAPRTQPVHNAVKTPSPKALRLLMGDIISGQPEIPGAIPAYQPTGLLLTTSVVGEPSTFIDMDQDSLEMLASRHIHTLIASKLALGTYIQGLTDDDGDSVLTESEFEVALWEYDCFKRHRMNWTKPYGPFDHDGTTLAERLFGKNVGKKDRVEEPKESASTFKSSSRSHSIGGNIPVPEGLKPSECAYLPVRVFRVYEAIKTRQL
ncbi:hypothetical protein BXZ70DRAFT_1006316 [Cristinia sonorae]|uniref:Methyltransferase domain-containing protein n=1 Tax=Cristinia sonorae TaxID=1940300 RepID=A0A8K0UTP9_9AGAR|nr:hypothetical protein BXZ70DRAFT_1006316 [Cristinia sonorae]